MTRTSTSTATAVAPDHEAQPDGDDWDAWMRWATRQPTVRALGLEPVEISDGHAVFAMTTSLIPLNPNGAVHGGLVAAVIDQVGSIATVTRADPGHGVLTCSLHIDFLRPARLPLTCVADVARSSRSVIFTRIEIVSDGAVCAAGTGTWLPKPYPAGVS